MIPPKIGFHGMELGPSNKGKVKRKGIEQKDCGKNKQRNFHLDVYKPAAALADPALSWN